MGNRQTPSLPAEYREHWELHRETIRQRLQEFRDVPREEYFFELLFCLLTPQSKAAHAERVIAVLRAQGFPRQAVDPVPVLRNPEHYIRFHNQKAKRLLLVQENWKEIEEVLASGEPSAHKRSWLVANVNGLGWKEASHVLRNIGHLDIAIIDRHILKHLMQWKVIEEITGSITPTRYLALEEGFRGLADHFGLTLQELDLLFWSFEEGTVRK